MQRRGHCGRSEDGGCWRDDIHERPKRITRRQISPSQTGLWRTADALHGDHGPGRAEHAYPGPPPQEEQSCSDGDHDDLDNERGSRARIGTSCSLTKLVKSPSAKEETITVATTSSSVLCLFGFRDMGRALLLRVRDCRRYRNFGLVFHPRWLAARGLLRRYFVESLGIRAGSAGLIGVEDAHLVATEEQYERVLVTAAVGQFSGQVSVNRDELAAQPVFEDVD